MKNEMERRADHHSVQGLFGRPVFIRMSEK